MKYKSRIKFFPFYLISLLPMPVLYVLSSLTYAVLYHIVRYRRLVVRENLKNSFDTLSNLELREIERGFYAHFCDIMVEAMKCLTISKSHINKRFKVKNIELIQKYYDQNKSIILYTAHQGNWEWVSFLPLFVPYKFTAFYQPLSNRYFDELMKLIRERFGTICIESNKGYRSIIEFEKKEILTLNCIIGDQSPKEESPKFWVQFLNQETAFLTGAEKIAKRNNQVLVFPSFRKLKRGYYELEFQKIEERPETRDNFDMVNTYAQLLEKAIRRAPKLWLWSHRRWKLTH